MFVPQLNDAHVVVGGVGKRQEDRNNEKYRLDLQREITIILEPLHVNTYSLQLKTNRITARRWQKCSLRPSDDVPSRWWGRA